MNSMNLYLLTKSLHIIFITSWFAGLFYLPRIFVNLALEENAAALSRLSIMGRRLFRFMTILAVFALLSGLSLLVFFGIGQKMPWMHAKLTLVIFVMGYHHACWVLLRKFEQGRNRYSHVWYRWFNEVPVVLLCAIVFLVVFKPV